MARHPSFLTTAVEAVTRAGDLQMAQFGGDFQIDKKGTIDLVTEVDVAVERVFRRLIAGNGVYLDGQVVTDAAAAPQPPQILQVGKRRFARLTKA